MSVLVAGLIVFLGVHSLPMFPDARERIRQKVGAGPYRGLYSLVALAGFVLIVWGYGLARLDPVVVFTPPAWGRSVTYLLMLPAFILLMQTSPGQPGRIAAAVKHPMLLAVKLWAFGHLLANGMLADVLLFGGLLAYAVIDRISMKKRGAAAAEAGKNAMRNDAIAIFGGVAVYAVFTIWLHPMLIGVPVY